MYPSPFSHFSEKCSIDLTFFPSKKRKSTLYLEVPMKKETEEAPDMAGPTDVDLKTAENLEPLSSARAERITLKAIDSLEYEIENGEKSSDRISASNSWLDRVGFVRKKTPDADPESLNALTRIASASIESAIKGVASLISEASPEAAHLLNTIKVEKKDKSEKEEESDDDLSYDSSFLDNLTGGEK
jgi:hypothetical protein